MTKKRRVKKFDVHQGIQDLVIYVYLLDGDKKAFKVHPATWNKIFQDAKNKFLEMEDVLEDVYHTLLLISAKRDTEVFQ